MAIVITGGGSAVAEREALECFARLLGDERPVLYLPVALKRRAGYPETAIAWLAATLGQVGVGRFETWASLDGRHAAELDAFSALFIGGGNTFDLLAELRASGLARAVSEFERRGGAVFGGSAGAIVLGASIETALHCDTNLAGLSDPTGLDLLAGHDVWCHFEEQHRAALSRYVRAVGHPVLALEEGAGLLIDQGALRPLGSRGRALWHASGESEALEEGRAWPSRETPAGTPPEDCGEEE